MNVDTFTETTTEKAGSREIRGMSLCSGYNGIGLGLELVLPSYRNICYVEREISAALNLVKKIEEGTIPEAFIWSDIKTFDGTPFRGYIDIMEFGIPCQPWSLAGKQKGFEDDRWIWEDVARIIVQVRPKIIFMEEVRGFIRGGLGMVIRNLADIGYMGTYDLFRASDLGFSHRRERLFVLAQLADSVGAGTGNLFEQISRGIRGENVRQRNGKTSSVWFGTTNRSSGERKELEDSAGIGRRRRSDGNEGWNRRSLQAPGSCPCGGEEGLGHTRCGGIQSRGKCGELGNSEQGHESGISLGGGGEKELGDSSSIRSCGYSPKPGETCTDKVGEECRMHESAGTGALPGYGSFAEGGTKAKELGNPTRERMEGMRGERERQSEISVGEVLPGRSSVGVHVARPGEDQYGWEAPRTVIKGKKKTYLPAEPPLGRKSYGHTHFVDELRLCGNGVVPAVAGFAFTVLAKRLAKYRYSLKSRERA